MTLPRLALLIAGGGTAILIVNIFAVFIYTSALMIAGGNVPDLQWWAWVGHLIAPSSYLAAGIFYGIHMARNGLPELF